MNPKPISETEAIRSDIEMTRQRMDSTIDALGERMKGRHLLDEAIGYFRSHRDTADQAASKAREKLSETAGKISDTAGSAANAMIDTVKKNPIPILLITAGAAWLAYNASRRRSADLNEDFLEDDETRYDPDMHYDRPLEYPGTLASSQSGLDFGSSTGSSMGAASSYGGSSSYEGMQGATDDAGSKLQDMKNAMADKASAAKEQVKEKFGDLSQAAKSKLQNVKQKASEVGSRVKERASQIGSQVGDRTRQVYTQSRERVVQTADQHPLPVGLGCLAAGILIGLAIPTPNPVNRIAGPTVDRLRNRTKDAGRDMMQKGRRVVEAATEAARDEAQSQGLTIDRLRQSGEKVAQRAGEAASDAAQAEGIRLDSGNQRAGAEPADPSAARPAM